MHGSLNYILVVLVVQKDYMSQKRVNILLFLHGWWITEAVNDNMHKLLAPKKQLRENDINTIIIVHVCTKILSTF